MLEGAGASEVDGIRRAFGSTERVRIPPHITVIPPVNVADAEMTDVFAQLRRSGSVIGPIDLVLGPLQTFPPRHNVVYLTVGGATDRISRLRDLAYVGPLLGSSGRETRDFVPHVTVTSRADERLATAALIAGEQFNLAQTFTMLTLLERDLAGKERLWAPIAEFPLGPTFVVGRGGRELSFSVSRFADPECAPIIESGGRPETTANGVGATESRFGGEPVVVIVRAEDQIVAGASGCWVGTSCVIDRFIVVATHRLQGIGRQLVGFIERLARDHGCNELAVIDLGPQTVAWFAGLGFSATPAIARRGPTEVAMFRAVGPG